MLSHTRRTTAPRQRATMTGSSAGTPTGNASARVDAERCTTSNAHQQTSGIVQEHISTPQLNAATRIARTRAARGSAH
eukprot:2832128-Rhodomonas_salina.1